MVEDLAIKTNYYRQRWKGNCWEILTVELVVGQEKECMPIHLWNTSIMEWNKENTVQEKHLQSCFYHSLIVLKNWKFRVRYGCQNTVNSEFVVFWIQELVLNSNRGLFCKTELQIASFQHLKANVKTELKELQKSLTYPECLTGKLRKKNNKKQQNKSPESNLTEMAKTSAGIIWRQIISDRNMVMA